MSKIRLDSAGELTNTVWAQCQDCACELTDANRAVNGQGVPDPYAAYCESCWRSHPSWEPQCEKHGVPLQQNKDRLHVIFCPLCQP
jgi:hypothetical protein